MNVVFLGCTLNYGKAFNASNTKVKLIADGLISAGAKCYIHDGLLGDGNLTQDEEIAIDGITCTRFKRRGAVGIGEMRNYKLLKQYLINHKAKNTENIGIVEFPMLHTYFLYCIALRELGYKIIAISHEWGTTMNPASNVQKLSNDLYTYSFGYIVDGILPISEYIIEKIRHFKKPYFKVPALANFNDFDGVKAENDKHYFLYCASAKYYRIVTWIIDAYASYLKMGGGFFLIMVLSGTQTDIDAAQNYLNDVGISEMCTIKTKLEYYNLQQHYKGASALLIPLDPNFLQDTARFPQKIAEYTASQSPIITSNIGEVKHYFDNSTAIISKYNLMAYAEKMLWTELNPAKAKEIAINAYELGRIYFDCMQNGVKLYNFLKSI